MIMPETITIDITQDDIMQGVRGDCARCPAARSIIRYFMAAGWDEADIVVLMSGDECDVMFPLVDEPVEVRYEPSPALEQFIRRFDRYESVESITTTLRQIAINPMH